MKKRQSGFTLIELLVVIGILAVLLAIVLIAINPARQFAQANNAKRSSDVNAILNAIHQYSADHRGNLCALSAAGCPDGTLPLALTELDNTIGANLCDLLVPTYIAALPVDPLTDNGGGNGAPVQKAGTPPVCPATWTTSYSISQSATDSRITVSAPLTELTADPADPTLDIQVLR